MSRLSVSNVSRHESNAREFRGILDFVVITALICLLISQFAMLLTFTRLPDEARAYIETNAYRVSLVYQMGVTLLVGIIVAAVAIGRSD